MEFQNAPQMKVMVNVTSPTGKKITIEALAIVSIQTVFSRDNEEVTEVQLAGARFPIYCIETSEEIGRLSTQFMERVEYKLKNKGYLD